MTKSIFENIQLTKKHTKVINYITSSDHIKKVQIAQEKRLERPVSIRGRELSQNIQSAMARF